MASSHPEDKGPTAEPFSGDSEMDPGLGRRGGTLESERGATGEPTDESPEMPVVDSDPYRPR